MLTLFWHERASYSRCEALVKAIKSEISFSIDLDRSRGRFIGLKGSFKQIKKKRPRAGGAGGGTDLFFFWGGSSQSPISNQPPKKISRWRNRAGGRPPPEDQPTVPLGDPCGAGASGDTRGFARASPARPMAHGPRPIYRV